MPARYSMSVVCTSCSGETRRELTEFLTPYRENALTNHPWKEWAEYETADAETGHRNAQSTRSFPFRSAGRGGLDEPAAIAYH